MQNENERPFFRPRQRGKDTRYYIDNELVEWAERLDLKSRDIAVYNAIARHAHSMDQAAFPSYLLLMKEAAVKNKRSLSSSLKKLERLNMVKIEHSRGRSSNIYILADTSCWTTNGGKIATVTKMQSAEQYQRQQANSGNPASNSGSMGTGSHISKSDKLTHKDIREMRKQLQVKFSVNSKKLTFRRRSI